MGLDIFEHGGLEIFGGRNATKEIYLDNVILALGTDSDFAQVLRSATLTANTALAGVLIGTPVTPALAANSVILSNVTADGDILIAGNDGGHSRTALFFDASAPNTTLYNIGGTWSAGATTWTIPAVTLGGTVTLNGQILNAGSSSLEVTTTESGRGINITSTQNFAAGARIQLDHISTSPAVDDTVGYIAILGYDLKSPQNHVNYGLLDVRIEDATADHADGKFRIRLLADQVLSEALTLSSVGALWAALSVDTLTYKVSGTQVVGARVVDVRANDAVSLGAYDATTGGVIDAMRDAMVTHGLLAAA